MLLPRTSREGVYDLAYVIHVAGEDEEFVLEMLKYFVKNTPEVLERLSNYSLQQNWPDMAAEAHRFGPGLNFLGIKGMEKDVRQLENIASEEKHVDQIPALVERICVSGKGIVETIIKDFDIS